MRELFIYYRVHVAGEATACDIVSTFQAELRRRFPGLSTRLLRRPQALDGTQTWMEVYAVDALKNAGGITVEIEREIAAVALALAPCMEGGRHVEAFVPLFQAHPAGPP